VIAVHARRAVRSTRGTLAIALLTLVGVALGGCGGVTAPDLFVVQRSGSGPSAKLTLLVNEEGGVTCNGAAKISGRKLKLSDSQLVQARAIQEDLHDSASEHMSLAPGPKTVLSYRVRDEAGTVSFSDTSAGQPAVLRQLALFVLRAAQQVCRLPE
jgi:hypothetical protein